MRSRCWGSERSRPQQTRLRHPGADRLFLQQLHNLGAARGSAAKAGGAEEEMLLDF